MVSLALLLSVAFAGWTETAREHGCVFSKGTAEGDVVPLHAECDWPVAPEKLHALLARNADHQAYFSAVEKSDVLSRAGGIEKVRQVHVAAGISDREVILDFAVDDLPGGKRYRWTKAADQSALTGAGVEPAVDTGKWEVVAGGSGSKVVYELRYGPGGSVPGFIVRWFQGSGFRTLVGELRTYAESH